MEKNDPNKKYNDSQPFSKTESNKEYIFHPMNLFKLKTIATTKQF